MSDSRTLEKVLMVLDQSYKTSLETPKTCRYKVTHKKELIDELLPPLILHLDREPRHLESRGWCGRRLNKSVDRYTNVEPNLYTSGATKNTVVPRQTYFTTILPLHKMLPTGCRNDNETRQRDLNRHKTTRCLNLTLGKLKKRITRKGNNCGVD